ncbi:MAG: dihydroorotase [Bacteroidota bacterium]
MEPVLFSQVTIQDPQSPHHTATLDVQVEDGHISKIAPAGSLKTTGATAHSEGSVLTPGWIDLEVYLNDPGFEFKESLEELATAGLQGGFTGLLAQPATHPSIDNGQMARSLLSRSEHLPIQFWLAGALTEKANGLELAEMFDMHQQGVKAFSDGPHPLPSAGIIQRSLLYLQSFEGLMIHTSLDPTLVGDGQMNEGMESTSLGMEGISELAETIPAHRDLELLDYVGGRMHIQGISSPRALDLLLRGKSNQPGLSFGVSLPHLLLNDEAVRSFDPNFKLFPPLRQEEARQALMLHVAAGNVDVLSSGHQAQGIEEKRLEFALAEAGMLGLQTFFSLVMEHLIQPGIVSWDTIIQAVCIRPREILQLHVPRIEEGQLAELSWFHPSQSWTLEAKDIPSRAKNSPWLGKPLTGKPLGSYVKGRFNQL